MNILQVLVKLRDDLKAWTLNLFDSYGSQVQIIADEKMNKINPTATGSLSLNRKPNVAIGSYSTTEGLNNMASGTYAHAEGCETSAPGLYAHTEGRGTTASGTYAHAEGYNTIARGTYQHVEGKFNVEDYNALHIVGNGSSNSSRSNAYVLDQGGNAKFAGIVSDSRGELLDRASFNAELEEASKELAPIVMQDYISNVGSLIVSFDGNVNKPFMVMDSSDDGIQIGYFKVSNNYKEIDAMGCITASGLAFIDNGSDMELPTNINYYVCWRQDITGGYQLVAATTTDIDIPYVIGIYSEDNEIGFTPGMYVAAIVDTAMGDEGFIAPYLYVKEVYDVGASNSYDIDWHNISFTNKDNYLQATNNQLIWNGVSHLPDYTNGWSAFLGLNVSMRGAEFIKLFKLSSGMLLETKDGEIAPLVFYRDAYGAISFNSDASTLTPCVSVQYKHKTIDDSLIESTFPTTPGIYFSKDIKSITFLGINNVDEIFNHKLPHEVYDCPAYEEIVEVTEILNFDKNNYPAENSYTEVDVGWMKIGSLEDFGGRLKITQYSGKAIGQTEFYSNTFFEMTKWDDAATDIYANFTDSNGSSQALPIVMIVRESVPYDIWTRGGSPNSHKESKSDLPPGVYAYCSGVSAWMTQMHYIVPRKTIHHLDEKFLPKGMMAVPIPEETDEGAILQVVNGKPTWVSLPAAEESEF